MFIPYDYQLDYLNSLHLFYYSFPPPIKVRYFPVENKQANYQFDYILQ